MSSIRYEIVIDSGETENKCTIARLAYRPDFHLFRARGGGTFGPLLSSVLLHHEGECLSSLKNTLGPVQGIASIDCVWRRLDSLLRRVERPLPVLAKIPDGFQTAYPRKSKYTVDPSTGLATIEAIFVATAILGSWDATLLSEYPFGRKFVEMNRDLFLDLGVHQAANEADLPTLSPRPRNALQRRRDRGALIRTS